MKNSLERRGIREELLKEKPLRIDNNKGMKAERRMRRERETRKKKMK